MSWHWIAKHKDGRIFKQPKDRQAAFLADLDLEGIVIFSLRKGFKTFTVDLTEGAFYKGKRIIKEFNPKRKWSLLPCKRTLVHQDGSQESWSVISIKSGRTHIELVIDKKGKYHF